MPTSGPTAPTSTFSNGLLTIRTVRWRDGRFLRQVRNHPQILALAGNKPVGWWEHWRWFLCTGEQVWIGLVDGKRAGYVRVSRGCQAWIISLAIIPGFWRYGLGLNMLRWVEADRDLTERKTTLWAEIEFDNFASRRLFEKAGFSQAPAIILPQEMRRLEKPHTLWYTKG